MVSELGGIAGVAELIGLSPIVGATVAAVLLLLIVLAPYKPTERVALGLGVFQAAFLVSWGLSSRDGLTAAVISGFTRAPDTPGFALEAVSGVGAVIMPWMIYFQQSAIAAYAATAQGSHTEAAHARAASPI